MSVTERPSSDFVKKTYRGSKVFTACALVFCTVAYIAISKFSHGDPVATQARFNTIFQSLLICAWTWFMFPYIRVTLQMMLYGVELNEKTASFFSKPEESPLVQYIEKQLKAVGVEQEKRQKEFVEDLERRGRVIALDIQKSGDTIRQEIAGLKEALTKPIKPPATRIVAPPLETKSAEPVESVKANGAAL